jgi:hypothetical protein
LALLVLQGSQVALAATVQAFSEILVLLERE